jgi:hypothetical protein
VIVRLVSGVDGLGLEAALPSTSVAYVDADWLYCARDAEIRVLVLDPVGVDPDARAAQAFARVARECVGHTVGLSPVHVTGTGVVATITRTLLGGRLAPTPTEAERPRAVIETTGDPEVILEATQTVSDLGVVVLAGESGGRHLDIDLYHDVHVRGLELAGVTPVQIADDGEEAASVPPALHAAVGSPLPRGGVWYRITPAAER